MNILGMARSQVTDVRNFLRQAASGNSLKYSASKGARHLIYFPELVTTRLDEAGNSVEERGINAYSYNVHEWNGADGKYHATLCVDGLVYKDENGNTIYNGVCPICNRISDGWDIYNYRYKMAEDTCVLTGEDRKKALATAKSDIRDERKAKEARTYVYVLVVQYRQENGKAVMGTDSEGRDIPEYDLKIMRMSVSRLEKLQQQISNAGAELAGSEITFEYPDLDDPRAQVSQSTTAPVFPGNKLVDKFPNLKAEIDKDIEQFDWNSIDKSFPELKSMSYEAMETMMDDSFAKWDEYKQTLKINPSARYMEYVVNTPVTNPPLGAAPNIPDTASNNGNAAPGIPEAPTIPNVGIPDVNSVFSGEVSDITI